MVTDFETVRDIAISGLSAEIWETLKPTVWGQNSKGSLELFTMGFLPK